MNKDKREPEYPAELESQFILRLPEERAKLLRELLKSGDNIKNRLTIQIDNDMRNGAVRFDHWLMHAKIIDLPTIIESLKTIDNKSFYKTADICQMMICKEEPDQTPSEEEAPSKNKKKDPYKVDKKFLWPHGITPPTKNVRKRRFRKTLKKKYVEAPEIEKEVKRLLRADNEAIQLSWEVIKEEDELFATPESLMAATPAKSEKKPKGERGAKKDASKAEAQKKASTSNVVDIFGAAVSDSDAEDDNNTTEMTDHKKSLYGNRKPGTSSITSITDTQGKTYPIEFESLKIQSAPTGSGGKKTNKRRTKATSTVTKIAPVSSEDHGDPTAKDFLRLEKLRTELEELKQRRQRTVHEIAGMENQALRLRFQEILHTMNQDVMYKEMEYQGLITLQNSEDI